jgi:hypothetical protein
MGLFKRKKERTIAGAESLVLFLIENELLNVFKKAIKENTKYDGDLKLFVKQNIFVVSKEKYNFLQKHLDIVKIAKNYDNKKLLDTKILDASVYGILLTFLEALPKEKELMEVGWTIEDKITFRKR